MLDLIRSHIASAGYHVTLVKGGQNPRFAYTVGLTEAGRPELVLAGAASLSADDVYRVLKVAKHSPAKPGSTIEVEGTGRFELIPVDPSWTKQLLLGALHYYDRPDVPALQILPDESLRTIDVPDLSVAYDPEEQPVWQWLTEPWPFAVSPDSVAMTNLDALQGYAVTEAARWEEAYWEVSSGWATETPEDEARAVPLATLLGFDTTLEPVAHLGIGDGLVREDIDEPWRVWGGGD